MEDEIREPWWKRPITMIMGLFLILAFIVGFLPSISIQYDVEPGRIPSIEEVFSGESEQTTFDLDSIHSLSSYMTTDAATKKIADKIVTTACPNYHKVCYAKALYYFVRDNVQYVNDPAKFEFVKQPDFTLEVEAGDCDDHSVLLASLLQSVGIETRFVFIPRHVYVQARLPEALHRYKEGDWVNVDSTCSNCEFGSIPYTSANRVFV